MARSKSQTNLAFRAEVADWLRDLKKRSSLSYDEIADRAGVGTSTLYRWMDEGRTDSPSHAALLSLSEAFGVPLPGARTAAPGPGFQESGLARLDPPEQEMPENPNQSWWRVRDRALELAGFLPGDQVLLDQSVQPRRGDAVVAQIYDTKLGAAETVLRLYAFPALVTRTNDAEFTDRADVIDADRVKVMGTVVRLLRDRRS